MTTPSFFQVAALFLIPLLAVLVPVLIGQYYGIYRQKKSPDLKEFPVGAIVGAAVGLLGFMLAFTFQIAINRYEARKLLLLEEVTSTRTTYLRAGLVPEPYRSNTRQQLVEYVDLRVALTADYSKLNRAMSRSQQILDSLWSYTEVLAAQDRSSEAYALYTSSVNDMVDLYNQRVTTTLQYRIPVAVLWILFIVEFLSMLAFGYQFGITGKGSFSLNLLLATVFAVVMSLIFALDRPEIGLSRLNQKPMFTLQQQLHEKQMDVRPIAP